MRAQAWVVGDLVFVAGRRMRAGGEDLAGLSGTAFGCEHGAVVAPEGG